MRIDNSCRNPPAHHHRCNHHHHHYREASNFFFLDYSTITFRCSASGCYYHQFDKDGSVIQRSSGSPSINHCNLNSFDGHHIILIIVYDIISFTKQYSLSLLATLKSSKIIKNFHRWTVRLFEFHSFFRLQFSLWIFHNQFCSCNRKMISFRIKKTNNSQTIAWKNHNWDDQEIRESRQEMMKFCK